jgi:hypothetical protein
MSIKRLSSANPYNQTVSDIDTNIFELNGLNNIAQFEKNEIDALYDDLALYRKFTILSGAGNSLATYINWSHVKSESGYSIWKIPFTNFKDNSVNEGYIDNISLTYKGKANQESYTSFDAVYLYDGSTYIDDTTEAATDVGTAFSLMSATNNFIYVGSDSTFSAIDFNLNVKGANYTLKLEYYNNAWTQLTSNLNSLVDNTSNFKSNARIEYTLPTDWVTTTVNSVSKYWIRISTTTVPVTTATAYSIFPGDSVYSLLQLSSYNVLNQEWAWCYFNNNIYVTIRNIGASAYEGNTYITSSSSTTNKQNYFIYNHDYKFSFEKASYTTGSGLLQIMSTGAGIAVVGTVINGTQDQNLFNVIDVENIDVVANSLTTELKIRTGAGISVIADNDTKTITFSAGGAAGTINHSELLELDYASSAHTGFQATLDLSSFVYTTGSNMIGALKVITPISDTDATNKTYVDARTGASSTHTHSIYQQTLTTGAGIAIVGTTINGTQDQNLFNIIDVENIDVVANSLTTELKIRTGAGISVVADNDTKTITFSAGAGSASSTAVRASFTNADCTTGSLTVTHNKNLSTPYSTIIQVYDNANKMIMPDEVTCAQNSFSIDLYSFYTGANFFGLSGNWGYVYVT